jgi:hypothetical protein
VLSIGAKGWFFKIAINIAFAGRISPEAFCGSSQDGRFDMNVSKKKHRRPAACHHPGTRARADGQIIRTNDFNRFDALNRDTRIVALFLALVARQRERDS